MWPFSSKKLDMEIERKASAALALNFGRLPPANWKMGGTPGGRKLADEGYLRNVVVFQAINRIADSIATIEWQVETEAGDLLDSHPLLTFLRRPNPVQSRAEWLRSFVSFLLLYGNTYAEAVTGSDSRRIVEAWILRSDRMKVVPGSTGLPSAYEYIVGQQRHRFPADPITGRSAIRHVKLWHPTDDWYGLSPLVAGAYAVDQHNESMSWIQSLLQNSARPSGALVVDNEENLTDEQFVRLKNELEEQYMGSANAGRPMLLEGGLDWKSMGLSPKDMESMEIKNSAARDISLALGVPPLLVNIPGDSTYSNYREARLAFYEDTVIPLVTYIADELSFWLGEFFSNVRLVPNFDQIEAIAEKRQRLWRMADESDELTLNEARALKGYPPLDEPLGSTLMAVIRSGKQKNRDRYDVPENEAAAREAFGDA